MIIKRLQIRNAGSALAALLVLSSLLVATPAGATTGQADAAISDAANPACPAPDEVAQQAAGRFRDITADRPHADRIGCIAYYGITTGTGDGTKFSPSRTVSRWQMALFMVRAVERAGVDIPDAATTFEDLDGLSESTVQAIGAADALGIMEGRNRTQFSPDATVRRDEMAVHLIRMLAVLTGPASDVHVTVNRESGAVTLTLRDGSVVPQDDSFSDVSGVTTEQRHAIGAVYELGVTAGKGDGGYGPDDKVTRAQMATFIIRALGHSGLRPEGPIRLAPPGLTPDTSGVYTGDPLQLVAHSGFARAYSLPGSEGDVFEVWLCRTPVGGSRYSNHPDSRHNPSNYADKFTSQVVAWFDWLSGGKYEPVFLPGGVVEVGSSSDYYEACDEAVSRKDLSTWTGIDGVVIVVGVPVFSDNVIGQASCGLFSQRSFPHNQRSVMVNGDAFTDPTLLAHEMGHALCWPHSYSGDTTVGGEIDEYDNPMDIMGSPSDGTSDIVPFVGTLAINRYAAGWIPTSKVEVHQSGTTEQYRLEPAGSDGTQLLIVPYEVGNRTLYRALGARVTGTGDLWWADNGIIAEGVEVYDIDQSVYGCDLPDRGYCHGLDRRTQPIYDDDEGYDGSDGPHVMQVGDGWNWSGDGDTPGISIDVTSRDGDTFTVDVKPYTEELEDDLGEWERFDTQNEWDDTNVVGYGLASEPTSGFSDPTGQLYVRCYGTDFDVFVSTDALVFGDYLSDEVWVNYRAGSADTVGEYWNEWDNDKLYPGDSSTRAVARNVADNPGRFLFRWQNTGSTDWETLRFADTSGLREVIADLDCY